MISFDEACAQIGYDRTVQCPISGITVWFAYKDGVSKKFDSKIEAQTFSKNVEPVTTNKKEIDAWWANQKKLENEACGVWVAALESEYIDQHFSKELFDLCYSEACDRRHSGGYDDVANYMIGIVEFACKIRQTS